MLIYKILLPSEWAAFETEGRFDGSPFDCSSGFIHCSDRSQVTDTAIQFFGNEPALVVLAIDAAALGDAVRWEPAAGGGRFPHVYGSLPLGAVVSVHHVPDARPIDRVLKEE